MTKGAYDINETYVGPTKDESFRSCLCAMLVFVSICAIILIVAWPWRNSGGDKQWTRQKWFVWIGMIGGVLLCHANLFMGSKRDIYPYLGNAIGSYDEQKGNKKENEAYKPKTTLKPYKPSKEIENHTTTTTSIPEAITISDNDETEVFTSKESNKHKNNKFEKLKDKESTTITNEIVDSKESELPATIPEQQTTTTEHVPTKSLNVDNHEEKSTTETETTETTTISISKTTSSFDQMDKNDNDITTTTDGPLTTTNINIQDENDSTTTDSSNIQEKNVNVQTTATESGEESSTITQVNELKNTFTTQQINSNELNSETTTQSGFYTTTDADVVTVLQLNNSNGNKYEKLIFVPTEDLTTTALPDDLTTTIISRFKKENSQSKDNENDLTTEYEKNSMDVTEITQMTTSPSTLVELTPPTIMETEEVDVRRKFTAAPENEYKPKNIVDDCDAKCREVGARILSKINHSGDACEEFYDYACGGDNSDNVPEDSWKRIAVGLDRINSRSPDVYKTFKNFYEHCLNYHTEFDYDKRLQSAHDVMWSVGQPDKAELDEKSALTDLLTRLLLHDSSPLFDISVDVDKDSQHFIFQLNVGKRFSTLQDKYGALIKKQKCLKESKKHIDFSISFYNYIDLAEMYNVYSNCQRNETYSTEIVDKSLELFSILTEYESSLDYIEKIMKLVAEELPPVPKIRKDIVTKKFDVRKISDLQLHYPMINWKQLFSNLVGKNVDEANKVQVYFSNFFEKLFNVNFLSISQLHESLIAMFAYDLYYDLMYPTLTNDPKEYCLKHSSNLMKEVASSLYLSSFTSKDIENDLKRVETLFDAMKTKLKELVDVTEWYSLGSKHAIIDKLNDMELLTYNSSLVWTNMNLIQNRMKSVNSDYGNYSEFRLELLKRNQEILYNMWNTMGYQQENIWWYFTTPYSKTSVSIYALNKIAFPPAMLFTKSNNVPQYISLAKLGFSLAKAIGYHFDHTGIQTIPLDKKITAAYEEIKTCTALTYPKDPVEIKFDGKNIKLKVTADTLSLSANEHFVENMAINLLSEMSNKDVADYEISWLLFNTELQQTFSRERLFFIALGQEHCVKPNLDDFFLQLFESENFPPSLILNNAVSNSQLFTQIFKCKEGALMNPVFTCKPFPVMDEPEDYDY